VLRVLRWYCRHPYPPNIKRTIDKPRIFRDEYPSLRRHWRDRAADDEIKPEPAAPPVPPQDNTWAVDRLQQDAGLRAAFEASLTGFAAELYATEGLTHGVVARLAAAFITTHQGGNQP